MTVDPPNPEHDYGFDWQLPNGQRARLSWNQTTGVLYLAHPNPAVADHPLLACDREAVEELTAGWEDGYGDLCWLRDRLWLAGATLPTWADPVSRGT